MGEGGGWGGGGREWVIALGPSFRPWGQLIEMVMMKVVYWTSASDGVRWREQKKGKKGGGHLM